MSRIEFNHPTEVYAQTRCDWQRTMVRVNGDPEQGMPIQKIILGQLRRTRDLRLGQSALFESARQEFSDLNVQLDGILEQKGPIFERGCRVWDCSRRNGVSLFRTVGGSRNMNVNAALGDCTVGSSFRWENAADGRYVVNDFELEMGGVKYDLAAVYGRNFGFEQLLTNEVELMSHYLRLLVDNSGNRAFEPQISSIPRLNDARRTMFEA